MEISIVKDSVFVRDNLVKYLHIFVFWGHYRAIIWNAKTLLIL